MPLPFTRLGRYEIRSQLGAGGMGEVFLGWDPDLEREIAIKILRDGGGHDRQQRFVQEARAASALHHPNVAHVYEIGSQEDVRFICMEYVEGETLRAKLRRGPMERGEALRVATQIASALAAAHQAGIIHRDVKPENVMVTPDGYAKVLDFGLAKLREPHGADADTMLKTKTGVAMGTLGYMAPEQFSGDAVTTATDVYALGVVLKELKSEEMTRIADKATQKNPADRYRDAGELLAALRTLEMHEAAKPRSRVPFAIAAAILIVAAAGWFLVRQNRRSHALQQLTVAEKLLKERNLSGAYEAAMIASTTVPEDPRIPDILAKTSSELTIKSDPPGAAVTLQRIDQKERMRMGVTPLKIPRVTRADYFLTVEKTGYATVTRPITTMPIFLRDMTFTQPLSYAVKLGEASKVPEGMVLVEGGPYRLGGFYRPSDKLVELREFFIDRHEVSNRDFAAFIRDGGYRRRELWKYPFVDGDKRLTFEEAMARFRDTTGLPAPRSWSGGVPPADREDHPVTDVTWYEASAFAEWKGKKLPTIYQWEKAARPPLPSSIVQSFPWGHVGEGIDATKRANFLAQGTMPVSSMPQGASPYGAHHLAGNVSEWCRNPNAPGYAARGGSWNDNVYSFGLTFALPAFYSAPTLGFRCAAGGGGDEGAFPISPKGFVPEFKPADAATFAEIRRRYDYAQTPVSARLIERTETRDWTRERVAFDWNGKSVPVILWLPKGFARPLQVIQFAPAGDVVNGHRTLTQSVESQIVALVRAGRAVFSVELEGFLGRPRPPGWTVPERGEEEYVDYNVERVTEMRRGLDYVLSRPDIDRTRLGFLGISAGSGPGVFETSVDDRFRSVAFVGTGFPSSDAAYHPAARRSNFVPYIRAPKLMLHGRYDEDTSLKSETEPMFRILAEPKKLEVYEGIHVPPSSILIPALTKWFDETMGAVGG